MGLEFNDPWEEFGKKLTRHSRKAELNLLAAVLVDAVSTYANYSRSTSTYGRRRFEEAEVWILSRARYLTSFEVICEYLELDAKFLRLGIFSLRDAIQAGRRKVPDFLRKKRHQ